MSKAPPKKHDAVDLLDADHIAVKKLFTEFKQLCKKDAPGEEKKAIADEICKQLTVHAQIEEEIFYPAVREATHEDDLLDEAEVEHQTAKDLIAQISGMAPEDTYFDARVTVLGEYIDHHVEEEREEMFTKARKSELDLVAMAQVLSDRKVELLEDFATPGTAVA